MSTKSAAIAAVLTVALASIVACGIVSDGSITIEEFVANPAKYKSQDVRLEVTMDDVMGGRRIQWIPQRDDELCRFFENDKWVVIDGGEFPSGRLIFLPDKPNIFIFHCVKGSATTGNIIQRIEGHGDQLIEYR